MRKYWLFKSEPNSFGIDDLAQCKLQTEPWDGVRNYQARNFMKDEMQVGDLGFFYHSSCKVPAIVGIVEIVKPAYPDFTAFDVKSKYFCSKSTDCNPIWYMVDVKLKEIFTTPISLATLKQQPEIKDMKILQKGNRLSITPVTSQQWKFINNKLKS